MSGDLPEANRPSLALIGPGKVGETLARLYAIQGWRIAAINGRNTERAARLAAEISAAAVMNPMEALRAADLTLITVPDDAIRPLADALAAESPDLHGKAVVHTSGAHGAEVLTALKDRGAAVGSLHPAYPFADVERSMTGLYGAAFAVEAEDRTLRAWLTALIETVNGRVLVIPEGKKALYHAALSIASNYMVTLYAVAERLLMGIGADHDSAAHTINGLLAGTFDNLRVKGIPDALTGPLVRADVGTLRAHLSALEDVDSQLVYLYGALARASFPMLEARGTPMDAVRSLFEQDNTK